MKHILQKLKGGDRRSIGKSGEAVTNVSRNPVLFADLFEGLFDDNPLVRMRAADAVEKITRERPELLQPWKRPLLETVSTVQEKEVRWHVAQMLPRLRLSSGEHEAAVQVLMGYLADGSSIVRTFSMQALADLAMRDELLLAKVVPLIERLTQTGTPAMRSRGRKLLKQFGRVTDRRRVPPDAENPPRHRVPAGGPRRQPR
jgi:HEAT repeat protein